MIGEELRAPVLVLTVGTGRAEKLEDTLFTPLKKSVEKGRWGHVVLLPSQETSGFANEFRTRMASQSMSVQPIPKRGGENDADVCFAHFDRVVAGVLESGCSAEDITLDFTRGTKAMSAALVLAGVGRGIPKLRYIDGARGQAGSVVPGTEQIREVRTEVASARRDLELAKRLMRRGNFEAVSTLLHGDVAHDSTLPARLKEEWAALREVAEIYGCWDRFDYDRADSGFSQRVHSTRVPKPFEPTHAMERWVRTLTAKGNRGDYDQTAAHLRRLACDLLASAERRVRDGHLEDAQLRCYRVLELVGQFRLFDRGLDSAALPREDGRVADFQNYLSKKRSQSLQFRISGTASAGRMQVARLLKQLGDSFGSSLLSLGERYAKGRNHGILIHGFEAHAAPKGEAPLRKQIRKLEDLLIEDDDKAKERIQVARSLDFSKV